MSLRTRRHDDAYDDIEITDPRVMRVLAHPVRLAALSYLQGHGPATATQLAPIVGATPSVTSWHLRHLAQQGLVTDWDGGKDRRQRWWQAAARGIRVIHPGEDAEATEGAEAAYRALGSQLIAEANNQVQAWQREVEPRLEPSWRAVADLSNTTVLVTAAEVEQILAAVAKALAPYVRRRDRRPPRKNERYVRMVRLVLPAAADDPRQ
jgi:DNA-binding transcriptional ArsR family regulator